MQILSNSGIGSISWILADGQKWTHVPVNTGISLVQALLSRMILGGLGNLSSQGPHCVGLAGRPCPSRPSGRSPTNEVPHAWLCACHWLSCPWKGKGEPSPPWWEIHFWGPRQGC